MDNINLGEWQTRNPEYISGILQSIPTVYDCIKYHKQSHTIDNIPGKGSCYPTVLACLLKLPLDQVPHFNLLYFNFEEFNLAKKVYDKIHGEGHYLVEQYMDRFYDLNTEVITTWLASKGCYTKLISQDWFETNKDKPYMAIGMSPRDVLHVVIYMNGEMIHDPHPSNSGIVAIEKCMILEKVD